MKDENLEFYGVIPCSYSWWNEDDTQNTELLGYQMRVYWASIISKNGEKYTVLDIDDDEYEGTIEEFLQDDLPDIFRWDICEEDERFIITENNSEFTFDKEVYNEWPHPEDQDDCDHNWHHEYFFKSKEDALIKMKELIESKDL
jgi:hypothetical protein